MWMKTQNALLSLIEKILIIHFILEFCVHFVRVCPPQWYNNPCINHAQSVLAFVFCFIFSFIFFSLLLILPQRLPFYWCCTHHHLEQHLHTQNTFARIIPNLALNWQKHLLYPSSNMYGIEYNNRFCTAHNFLEKKYNLCVVGVHERVNASVLTTWCATGKFIQPKYQDKSSDSMLCFKKRRKKKEEEGDTTMCLYVRWISFLLYVIQNSRSPTRNVLCAWNCLNAIGQHFRWTWSEQSWMFLFAVWLFLPLA